MHRFSLTQRFLHWLVVVMVALALIGGAFLEDVGPGSGVSPETADLIFTFHKTMGILILGTMLLRIGVRLALGAPRYKTPLTPFERKASKAVHVLLYGGLVLMPVLGWLATGASGYPVQFFGWALPPILPPNKALGEALYGAHGALANLLIALIALHVAAAIMHAVVKRDDVFSRIV